jgi:DNA-binding SARP family transcriptional activator
MSHGSRLRRHSISEHAEYVVALSALSSRSQPALKRRQVLRLHTLGSTFLAAADGQPLAGAATQRRTLALLAILSVAGDAGLSRDKLLGLLWPESDAERARHSLTQALYAARRALGLDDLFVATGADIRLNGERLASDVRELEGRLASGDLEGAVGVYGGPFLDGFFLSGSPEFEHWSAQHRDRFQAKVAEALEQLAARAEARGDRARGLEWRLSLIPSDAADD